MAERNLEALAAGVREGDRRALARAITLVESVKLTHRREADALLAALLPDAGNAMRIGISGVPGVGKSTLIEALGKHVISLGHRIAVLAVDPSSKRSGGSILGDKTRMEELARDEAAYIRPSPAGRTLGGVARRTREAMTVVEAAGFDVVLVETVGVGQSETAVSEMTDMFVLMLQPAGGDDLQGMKKGIVELADIVLVNKADGPLLGEARRTASDYQSALRLVSAGQDGWQVPVRTCSALTGDGIGELWTLVQSFFDRQHRHGALGGRRAAQALRWMWREVEDGLVDRLRADSRVQALLPDLEDAVGNGRLAPASAAGRLVSAFLAGVDRAGEAEEG